MLELKCFSCDLNDIHRQIHSPYSCDMSVVGILGMLGREGGGGVNDDASRGGSSLLPPALSKLSPVRGLSLPLLPS
jgi:hypothetical protein